MRELSFSEKFALISLNGKEKAKINSDKKVVLKCIAAASIVELYLSDSFVFDDGILSVTEDDIKQQSISKYQKVVLDGILKKRKIINDKFIICINEVVSLRCKTLKNIESLYISTFYNINCIEEKSILLNDYTSKKDKEDLFKYYNTKEEFYLSLINELRY
ncbi:hypothetical protein, partial [Clostridium sp.]|uniref:hypothetical protein n=1 Tax=Clostridium sp. TaxID=1506 RepID=UPI003F3528D1